MQWLTPVLGSLWQEACHEFKASLCYKEDSLGKERKLKGGYGEEERKERSWEDGSVNNLSCCLGSMKMEIQILYPCKEPQVWLCTPVTQP